MVILIISNLCQACRSLESNHVSHPFLSKLSLQLFASILHSKSCYQSFISKRKEKSLKVLIANIEKVSWFDFVKTRKKEKFTYTIRIAPKHAYFC